MKKALSLILITSLSISIHAQRVYTFDRPEKVQLKLERITRPLTELPEEPNDPTKPVVEREQESFFHYGVHPNPAALPAGADPVLQPVNNRSERSAAATTSTVLSSWAGLSAQVQPSDNTLAVGPNHIVQMTNNSTSTYMRIWNKAGTVLVANKTVKTFSGISDYGDPNIIYDQAADRFVFVLLYSKSAKRLEVCVSVTNDPTGSYYVYSFTTNGFPDYPKLGVWGNSYFITTNSTSPMIYALDRTSMLAGSGTGTAQQFALTKFPSIGFQAASPVTQTGAMAPPAGSPATVIRVADDAWGTGLGPDHLEVFKLNISWTTPSSSTISGPFNIPTAAYNSSLCGFGSASCIPQPNTTTKLDPLSDILMDKVQYRNLGTYESIVCSHVCNADGSGKAGVRWYELRKDASGNWSIYQQSTFSPNSDNRFMSCITMNDKGKIAMGYNVSSTSQYPSIAITGRDSCDALNAMTVSENMVATGTASNSSSRYGDYNAMVVDPSDGSFWMTAQYNSSTIWSTKVIHFNFTDCPAPAVVVQNPISASKSQSGMDQLEWTPNPSSGIFKARFQSSDETQGSVQVYDVTGKLVMYQESSFVPGVNEFTLNLSELNDAVYVVKLTTPSFSTTSRLMLQR